MSLRIESNYLTLAGLAPLIPDSTPWIERRLCIHEYTVDVGYKFKFLMALLSAEALYPVPITVNYTHIWIDALLDTLINKWETRFETRIQGVIQTARQFTPRLIILPIGNGITLSAGQGLKATILPGTTTVYRYWASFWGDSTEA